MNSNEIKTAARESTVALLNDVLAANDAIQFADASWAILQTIDGQEVWTEITVKSKAYKPTKTTSEFDPFQTAEAWQEEKRIKAETKAEKEAEKQKKIASKKSKQED